MKVLHTADWHLGKIIHGKSLIEDQKYFIDNCFLKAISSENPDIVIIAGDIYDRAIAPIEAISLFNYVINTLYENNITVLCISGNHDSPKRIATYSDILNKNNIFFRSDISGCFNPITISKNNQKINFFLLPYFDLVNAKLYFNSYDDLQDQITSIDIAYKIIIDKIYEKLNKDELNVLISHCFITGSSISDSENPLFVGNSCEVGSEKFSIFDYVALGHLHSYQKNKLNMCYSGSPLNYSFNEPSSQKSMNIINFKNKHDISIKQIPIKPLREMLSVEGYFEDLINSGKLNPNDNYIRIILKDNNPVFMPLYRLREFYPNILTLSSNLLTESEDIKPSHYNALSNEQDIFKSFMQDICSYKVNEDDLTFFNKALKKSYKEIP